MAEEHLQRIGGETTPKAGLPPAGSHQGKHRQAGERHHQRGSLFFACFTFKTSSVQLGRYPFSNIPLTTLLMRTLSPTLYLEDLTLADFVFDSYSVFHTSPSLSLLTTDWNSFFLSSKRKNSVASAPLPQSPCLRSSGFCTFTEFL